ncbi:Uncharacterised protein [Actinomyces bovis]|uniref:Uncharacterized protein n=1 Tax=Actinomyces bovis TaxID=1658 RepID=A0ABY1VMT9_9ACTO|nr:DUF6350 family protein [Actinomyces bovis]SPT53415.1 Uncharacterised protein [Actinomyces bovis]VEG52846.1 Uncharacterised protein [Actinomyces israelii]
MTQHETRRPGLVPKDWPWALRVGLETVFVSWFLVLLPVMAIYLSGSAKDVAAALAPDGAVRTATRLWSLGLGGAFAPLTGTGEADDQLSLPLLGLTVLQAWWAWGAAGRAKLVGPLSALWVGLAAAGGSALLCLNGGGGQIWWAVLGAAVVIGAVALARQWRDAGRTAAEGTERAARNRLLAAGPDWLAEGLLLAARASLVLLVAAVVTAGVMLVTGWGRVQALHHALAGGGVTAIVALVILQLGWLPTLVIWALSWLTGAGFSVGDGTRFTPGKVVAGPVPSLPLLGALPDSGLGAVAVWVALVPLAVAALCAWSRRRRLCQLSLPGAVAACAAATGLLVVGAGLAFWAASGSAGPGRLTQVGPSTLGLVLLLVECGTGLCLTTVLLHPRTREHVTRTLFNADSKAP